jgi:cytidine deaminase
MSAPQQKNAIDEQALLARADAAAARAYAPYSKFYVGAAVLLDDGRIFEGCNVENVSYGLTNCAERTAIFSAVAASDRKPVIRAVAATNRDAVECSPCGACRQVIAEFSTDDTVILYRYAGGVRRITMRELLPDGFKFTH